MDQFLATTTIVLTMAFQPPVSIESDDGQIAQKSRAGEASAEFIEIIYQGQTTRVPLDSSGSNEVQIDNSQLRIQILSDGGSDSTINNAGSSFESNALPPTSGAETTEPDGFTLSRDAMIMGIVLGVTLLGILVYFLVIDPMRRRRGLEEAQLIIQEDRRPQFDRAEELLDQSLLAGMRKKDIVKARFLLAYLRTTMGRHEEAATVLGDLEKSQAKIDQPTAFLMLYVNAKLQNYERVERIYLAHQPDFSGDEQPELIVSIAFLNLA